MANCGTILVVPAFDPDSVSTTCPTIPEQVAVGEQFTLSWTIKNENDPDARVDYEVAVGGSVVDMGTETVAGTTSIETPVVIESISGPEEDLTVEVNLTNVQEA